MWEEELAIQQRRENETDTLSPSPYIFPSLNTFRYKQRTITILFFDFFSRLVAISSFFLYHNITLKNKMATSTTTTTTTTKMLYFSLRLYIFSLFPHRLSTHPPVRHRLRNLMMVRSFLWKISIDTITN